MSETAVLRLENLGKSFGRGKARVDAVKGIDLEIGGGQVYGFLGPNGAGKTTTIRMMLDLIRPTQGTAYLYGQNVRESPDVLRRVGALVEATFYKFLSGRKNLEVLARTGGYYEPKRVAELLEAVRLANRDQRVKGYSTGMKKRLGLAAALLNDPNLVLLDEPTTGLDPNGIHEFLLFIRQLVEEEGKTVFLSSHQLAEVEQVCDRVAIINKGEIVREGAVAELLSGQARLHVEAMPLEKAQSVLGEHWDVASNGKWLLVNAAREDAPQVVCKLVEQDIDIYQISTEQQTLEDYFLAVTETGDE